MSDLATVEVSSTLDPPSRSVGTVLLTASSSCGGVLLQGDPQQQRMDLIDWSCSPYNSIDGVVPNLDDITRKLIIPPMTTTIDTLVLCPPYLASAHVNLINGSAVAKG